MTLAAMGLKIGDQVCIGGNKVLYKYQVDLSKKYNIFCTINASYMCGGKDCILSLRTLAIMVQPSTTDKTKNSSAPFPS